ncbi:type I secretion system permease/ATPase [Rhizorhapis sp. SPR117]|uniref:type I secretion system permease/ATPase n=1 Tax=Rhizorhapis sp. SPR117 TaxID=2912611 RepID=UPI001F009EED|nr:type I secretion system permease/ATPase [Rhizorhapis sp. SPR117]
MGATARQGESEPPSRIAAILKKSKSAFYGIFVLSAALNVLLLGGAIYMMMVYDIVLPAGSLPTLAGLLMLVILVYLFQGIMDIIRARLLSRVSATIDHDLNGEIFQLIQQFSIERPGQGESLQPVRDLDQIRNFLSSGGPLAFADLPWMVFFIVVLMLLHWALGLTVLIGALVLLGLTFSADRLTRVPTQAASQCAGLRLAVAETSRRHAEVLKAMAMGGNLQRHWTIYSRRFLETQQTMADTAATLGSASKMLRMLLQSLVLTVGAILVIDGKATGGIIFASSILASRALAPVEQAIGHWRGLTAARQSWRRLEEYLPLLRQEEDRLDLPVPCQDLRIENLAIAPPGVAQSTLAGISFRLVAGEALGIIGPSGSGKSTLVRALAGIWPAVHGHVRLDGATLDQYAPEKRGRAIGYLPQNVELLDGSISDNIARFSPDAATTDIIAAAQMAGVHDMIKRMSHGYGSPVGPNGAFLSAGQRQRIALARALYGNPFLLVLDEPNSNLDPDGEAALMVAVEAVRARGGIVLLVAHRRSILSSVNLILHLSGGRAKAIGPREKLLADLMAS